MTETNWQRWNEPEPVAEVAGSPIADGPIKEPQLGRGERASFWRRLTRPGGSGSVQPSRRPILSCCAKFDLFTTSASMLVSVVAYRP